MTFKQTFSLTLTDTEISTILDMRAILKELYGEMNKLNVYKYKYVDRRSIEYALETLAEILDARDIVE